MLNNNQKQKREGVFKQMSKITPRPPVHVFTVTNKVIKLVSASQ